MRYEKFTWTLASCRGVCCASPPSCEEMPFYAGMASYHERPLSCE